MKQRTVIVILLVVFFCVSLVPIFAEEWAMPGQDGKINKHDVLKRSEDRDFLKDEGASAKADKTKKMTFMVFGTLNSGPERVSGFMRGKPQ